MRTPILIAAIALASASCSPETPTSPTPIQEAGATGGPTQPTAPPAATSTDLGTVASGDPRNGPATTTTGSSRHGSAVTTTATGNAPGAVTSFSGAQVSGQNAVRLTWSPPTTGGTPTSYSTTRGGYDTHTVQATSCSTTCETTYDALTHDEHQFSVEAINDTGRGEESWLAVTVSASNSTSTPGTVTNLTASQAAANEDVTVSWSEPVVDTTAATPPGEAADYRVEATSTNWVSVASSACASTGCSHTFTNLGAGSHTITVTPSNTAGSGPAASVSITVVDRSEAAAPGPVTGLTATQVGDTNAADITWSAPTTGGAVIRYGVTRSGGTEQTVSTSSCSAGCSYRDDNLMFGVHTWTVAAVGASGRSTATVSVNVDQPFTATLDQAPSNHSGSEFTVRLSFSEDTNLSYRTLRDNALEVTNGRVRRAGRVNPRAFPGRNREWSIRIRPIDGNAAVAITVPVRQCHLTGALCTDDDRQLEAAATATVQP